MKSSQLPLAKLLILLAALTALAPLAIDTYLPAIPTMAISFATSIHDVELSLSLFLAGFSAGQLLGGPISDHFGRRHTIFIGLLIFALGTLGIILSTTLTQLLIFRVIEAFGGGMTIVNSGAIIRDISSGKDSARNLSHMALIMMLAPLLAPMIGSTILHFSNWHSIFIFLLAYTLIITVFIYQNIPETRRAHPHKISAFQRYLLVLKHRQALGYIFSLCFAYGGMFTFITASPSLYMGYFGISEAVYPFLFGANIVSMIFANRLNVMLLKHYSSEQLLSLGQVIQLSTATMLLTYITLSPDLSLPILVGLIMLFVGAQSFIVSNATSSTIEFFPHNSGTASALLGATGFATGALAGTVVGLLGDGTPFPMAAIMLACIVSGISLRFLVQRY
jgi:DHA1 family bicyclomycin/chloramphenicol resistance-like MFS transporter